MPASNTPESPLASATRALGEALAPFVVQLQHLLERLRENPEWLDRIRTFAFFAEWWTEHAPHELKKALREAAIFPHPNLTSEEVAHLIATYANHGTDAATAELRTLNENLLSTSEFRQELASRWKQSRRAPVLQQILAAHDAGFYAVSIPAALAQAEGLVADAADHRGRLCVSALRAHLRHLVPEDDFLGPVVHQFVGEFLFAQFEHGQAPPTFSRHAILHGGDIAYGTRENSVCAVLWLDYLLIMQSENDASDFLHSG